MSFFEAVFGMVLVVSIVGGIVAMRLLDHKRESGKLRAEVDGASAARLKDLEERVRVLESIVTDRRFDLRQKIDSL